jgi:hypothetical protein
MKTIVLVWIASLLLAMTRIGKAITRVIAVETKIVMVGTRVSDWRYFNSPPVLCLYCRAV